MFHSRFDELSTGDPVTIAEYIWVNGPGCDIRSKTLFLHTECSTLDDFPTTTVKGKVSEEEYSDVVLKPVYYCPDPFRVNPGDKKCTAYLVLCETYNCDESTPLYTNMRHIAIQIFEESLVKHERPWFGWQQEYVLMETMGTFNKPIGFPDGGFAAPQLDEKTGIQRYLFGNGASIVFGREIAETHMRCCLAAGLDFAGLNADEFPGQWEFRIGPVEGINGCDQLWIARYILVRVAEEFGCRVSFEPRPVKNGEWSGSGCHTAYSTLSTRAENGYEKLIEMVSELGKHHESHLFIYDSIKGKKKGVEKDQFTFVVSSRNTSIRIPVKSVKEKKGFLEDRRPNAHCDPYLVGGALVDTTLLKCKYEKKLVEACTKIKSASE